MRWIGQHIWDFISRFRNDVYFENLQGSSETTSLVVDSNGKVTTNTLSGGGGISNIVEDTTPQLGGTLDAQGNSITEVEDIGLRDRIYHDGDITTYIQFPLNDSFRVVTDNTERVFINNSSTVFNENGSDVTFRVEGVGRPNGLVVSGKDGRVGINKSTPTSDLDVVGDVTLTGNISVGGTVDGVDIAGRDHDSVTLAGTPDYITISGQEITRRQIDLTADVTGELPVSNFATKDEDDMSSDSNTHVPTQQSVKAYVDSEVSSVPVVIHQFMGYLPNFTSGRYYYGHNTYGPYHHVWTNNLSSEPTTMNSFGASRHGLFLHIVPADLKNISIKGYVQNGLSGTNDVTIKVYKTTRPDGIAASNASLNTAILSASTGSMTHNTRGFNADDTSTATVSAGEALVIVVVPTGTSTNIRFNYTLYGFAN